jgi:signal transduction histidine kinase
MEIRYSPQFRIERIIIACRIVLAVFSLFAAALDPIDPPQHALLVNRILGGFLAFSLALLPLIWLLPLQAAKVGIVTHIVDILTFNVLVFFTEGIASPFFSYFVFTLFCGALRWQLQGALWTALAFLLPFLGTGVYSALQDNSADDQLNRLIIRATHLLVITLLLVCLTTYERNRRNEVGMLANWPARIEAPVPFDIFLRDLLTNVAKVMNAPRILLFWGEREEPVLHNAYLSASQVHYQKIRPDTYDPLVAAGLEQGHFLCKDTDVPRSLVLLPDEGGMHYRSLSPLHPELKQCYAIKSVIGLKLDGQKLHGWLFVLDKPGMIADDLSLGVLVSHQVSALMDRRLARADLQRNAAAEERIKMAHNLHDGLLQTLTGIALQIQILKHLLENDVQAARKQLADIQNLIVEEQRSLRNYIVSLKPSAAAPENHQQFSSRLQNLAATVQQLWGIKITLTLPPSLNLRRLSEDIYNLLRESLVNSARHAQATQVRASLGIQEDYLCIRISDDGRGFPFYGSYDLAELTALEMGPRSLIERIKTLDGQLCIESSTSGSSLTISVPLCNGVTPQAFSFKPGEANIRKVKQ